ncbi:MAG TPA: hypothetical protein VNS52_15140 [Gemmatimonadaceae bacterium]|nr:hypothetical protein [Gemmatimonadaceae bacterium]
MTARTPRRRPTTAGVLACVLLSCLAAAPVSGQAAPATPDTSATPTVLRAVVRPVGTEVRIYAPAVLEGGQATSPWIIGRLVGADAAGVTVQTATGATTTIPRSLAMEFSVRAGLADRAIAAGQGALFGAALGFLAGRVSTPDKSANTPEPGRHLRNGMLIGAFSGAVFAAVNHWYHWTVGPVPTATSAAGAD